MRTEVVDRSVGTDAADFDLDVRTVESGDAAEALLRSTDNGCNTVQGQDC